MVGRLKGNIKGSTNLSVKNISANLSVAKNGGGGLGEREGSLCAVLSKSLACPKLCNLLHSCS